MTLLINSMLTSAIDNPAFVESFQVVCVFTLLVFLIEKLLTAAAAERSRFAQVLNQAIDMPLVTLLMLFAIIALLRVVLIIQQ